MSAETVEIKYGLAGVVVDETSISKVMQEINSLTYRGYPVQELAQRCSFEEVAWLLWSSELPSLRELEDFSARERIQRDVSQNLISQLQKFPDTAHPMDTVRTAVSLLALEDAETGDNSLDASRRKAMRLYARLPTVVAALFRQRKGLPRIAPRVDLSYSENFFHMCFGAVPKPEVVKCFEQSMVLYAEHSFNASTFTGRVVMSTESDIYSAVTAAIGALKGALHGGANEAVMHAMLEIGKVENVVPWLEDALANKRKIMGFGHRVYRNGDSRVPTMKQAFLRMAEMCGDQCWAGIYEKLEAEMLARKNIHPNLDFPAGPAYYLMGFDIDFFTPLFVMSRITGWTAHFIEQQQSNRLIRPLSAYNGPEERHLSI
ncbi:MAG: 2-methylcitrate synthase [Porticoccus sp.]|nr:MAG: 2-methylcitrate synthase [Porticoccus sp.]